MDSDLQKPSQEAAVPDSADASAANALSRQTDEYLQAQRTPDAMDAALKATFAKNPLTQPDALNAVLAAPDDFTVDKVDGNTPEATTPPGQDEQIQSSESETAENTELSPEDLRTEELAIQAIVDATTIIEELQIDEQLGLDYQEDESIAAMCLAERILREDVAQREELMNKGRKSLTMKLPIFRTMGKSLESTLERDKKIREIIAVSIPTLAAKFKIPEARVSAISRAIGSLTTEVFYGTRGENHLIKRARFNPNAKQLDAWGERWKQEVASSEATPPTASESNQ
jgi:hypothetical protein